MPKRLLYRQNKTRNTSAKCASPVTRAQGSVAAAFRVFGFRGPRAAPVSPKATPVSLHGVRLTDRPGFTWPPACLASLASGIRRTSAGLGFRVQVQVPCSARSTRPSPHWLFIPASLTLRSDSATWISNSPSSVGCRTRWGTLALCSARDTCGRGDTASPGGFSCRRDSRRVAAGFAQLPKGQALDAGSASARVEGDAHCSQPNTPTGMQIDGRTDRQTENDASSRQLAGLWQARRRMNRLPDRQIGHWTYESTDGHTTPPLCHGRQTDRQTDGQARDPHLIHHRPRRVALLCHGSLPSAPRMPSDALG
jgi:hypothetical protein